MLEEVAFKMHYIDFLFNTTVPHTTDILKIVSRVVIVQKDGS